MRHYKKISIRKKHAKKVTKNKSRKQRLWKMKGCAKFANMKGGCGTCSGIPANNMMMSGGCGCGAQANNMIVGGGVCAGDILAYPHNNYRCNDNFAYTGKGGSNFFTKARTKSQSQFIDDNLHIFLGGYGRGASYPSGQMGDPWTSKPTTWPGVSGVQGDRNYLAYNNYSYPQADRTLVNTEAMPFTYGGKPTKPTKSKKHTFRKHIRNHKTNKHNKHNKYQKGGLPSLGILTDIKNTWNTLRGNNQLASPLPFNDQLENQQEALNM
jgi:hypothetical protein